MPLFKDDQVIIIAPGSQTTLAQMGLPESFTPAKLRMRSCMFPGSTDDKWEPHSVRQKEKRPAPSQNGDAVDGMDGAQDAKSENGGEATFEEDWVSEEGAVWPIQNGRIANWPCFLAFLTHVCNSINLNAVFYTPILLIAQPCWSSKDHERIAEFFFEKFKVPALGIMDAAVATLYAYGVTNGTIIDVGKGKADVTAVTDFIPHETGRTRALSNCGGDSMTDRLLDLLKPKGFTWEMCEQLKKSAICEILPPGTPLPGSGEGEKEVPPNPAAAASTGANSSGPGQRTTAGAMGDMPRGPGEDTEVGGDEKDDDESEGVLDVASIVTGGKMTEYLARKEKEKAEKAAAKKKGGDATAAQQRQVKLPNSKRDRNTFMYEDHALLTALKDMNLGAEKLAEAQAALDETSQKALTSPITAEGPAAGADFGAATNGAVSVGPNRQRGPIRREIEVGVERLQAGSGGICERIADAIHRTISSVEEHNRRGELWDSLILVGNGAKVRGFKDALMSVLQTKYLISPSSGTIFTSELPSNLSTPTGTGANTPQPQLGPHGGGSGVNPLLLAATTAQNPHLHPGSSLPSMQSHNTHSSHGQTPMSIKFGKVPEYFPEWKEVGYDEASFLGAQVAAKVLFIVDQGLNKGFMTRSDFNEQGPQGIHDYVM